ncbi:hypothetical protein [Parvicella tangerina]|uniref:Uncharacterized protein n=1 Tax=Parvicella tangerina TaxID=2829795 RepID=A0A916NDH5_9FLAO|nr:hypothetical protein [Parvicella tangerina]CAG5085343.1 hypothetical protein CRYO30217_02732 [Parvicella tangerina]
MKKFILPLVAVGFIFAGTSCKKDYTCSCTTNGVSYDVVYKESTKAAAAAVCEGKGIGSVEVSGQSVDNDTGCTLQ